MVNQVNFSATQLAQLKALLDAYKNDTTNNAPLIDAYNLVNSWIQPDPGVDSQTKLFFRLAVEVNNDLTTAANTYIRSVTQNGLLLDIRDASPQKIQQISNAIASAIFTQIGDDGGLPPLVAVIKLDVTGAITTGGQTWGGWGGALFFLSERVGPNQSSPESLAKLIFSSSDDTIKFDVVSRLAAKQVIDDFGVTNDFHDALTQAVSSGFSTIVGGSDLSIGERGRALFTLSRIGVESSLYAYRNDPDGFKQELKKWIPVDLLSSTGLPSFGDMTINAADTASVQTAIADADLLEDLAKRLPINAIIVKAPDNSTAAWFGSARSNLLVATQATDTMFGGDGTDTYVFKNGDVNDRIVDSDRRGRIVFDDAAIAGPDQQRLVAAGLFIETQAGMWTSPDGRVTLTHASPFTLHAGNANIDIGENVQSGDFGIRLVSSPTAPQNPVRTFFGDKQDWDSDPDTDGIQPLGDGFGNSFRADGQGRPDIAEPDRADLFYGAETSEVERFTTAGGDDEVRADGLLSATSSVGGRDLIESGAGRDIVTAGVGDDWVEGGSGADILAGNAGDDAIYADTTNGQTLTIQQAIATGETEARSPNTGELLTGDAGQDMVFGAATDDLLLGGEGADIVIGGGGDDTFYGDWRITTADRTWTIQRTVTVQGGVTRYEVTGQNNITFAAPGAGLGAADAIYGGAGLDWVFAGDGDDYIDTGNDNDVAFGEAGADVLIGGAGDDVLSGDNTLLVFGADEGADYLDGGAGNDTLLGDGGDDIIYGGAGDDYLGGGAGADILFGGPGTDVLAGGAGKDTYVFNRGDGVETILDVAAGADNPEASVLILGEGISRADIKFRVGSLMVDLGQGDAIDFEGFDAFDPLTTPLLDSIQFADGTAMSYQDVLDQGFDIDGTEGDDTIDGTAVTDRIDAKGGNDVVSGRTGDDSIIGGAGNDVLLGEAGNDVLSGGEGTDSLDGDYGDDVPSAVGADVVRRCKVFPDIQVHAVGFRLN